MSQPVISVEHLSKAYRLGQIGTGTLTYDMKLWWAKVRGKPNPLLRIGEQDHGNRDGEMIWALKDVSFKVEQGEVLGIIGRNGAGKSTLLKILSRVTAPTSGRITGKGRIASLLEVGTGFHPDLTGRENIYLNGAILGMSRREIERKFDEIVDFAEIEKFIDTPVKRYSSGMYVRLAFAVAAHLEPEILVVDEVLAVGDAEFQKKCLGKMGDVAKDGRTVLFVSHNLGSIEILCSRAILLNSGTIIKSGFTREVLNNYISEFRNTKHYSNTDKDNFEHPYPDSGARFVSVKIKPLEGEENTFLTMGSTLSILMGINALQFITRPWIGVDIRTVMGDLIYHAANREAGFELPRIENDCVLECNIGPLNLLPGRYYIDLVLSDIHGTSYDKITAASFFDVRNSKNADLLYTSEWKKFGLVYFPSNWKILGGKASDS